MIDFHSHILPKMDDGSKSTEESVALLNSAYDQGVEAIFSTPHFYPKRDEPELFLKRREHSKERLFSCQADVLKKLPIYFGAEVAFFYGMSRYECLDQFSLGGSQYLLVEMPFDRWTEEEVKELIDLKEIAGFIPILAHIERYLPFGNKKFLSYLISSGILIQSNAEFFLSKRTRHKALRMVRKGQIHILGSDCHNTESRPENMGDATKILEKARGSLRKKIEENERQILERISR